MFTRYFVFCIESRDKKDKKRKILTRNERTKVWTYPERDLEDEEKDEDEEQEASSKWTI